jgi:hypothetical protein
MKIHKLNLKNSLGCLLLVAGVGLIPTVYAQEMCDPEMHYPASPPGSHGGCGVYDDCNGNTHYDLGEPCHEPEGMHPPMDCPPPDMPGHEECMGGMHPPMDCPPPDMPGHEECMEGTHPPMDCPPPDMPGHEECMEGMKPPMGDGMHPPMEDGAFLTEEYNAVHPPMDGENSIGMRLPCPVLDESDPTCINPRGKLYLIPMPEQPKCDRQLMKKGEVNKPNRCVNICVRKMDDENQYHGAHVRRCEEKFGGEYTKQKKWCKNNKDNHKWEKHCS